MALKKSKEEGGKKQADIEPRGSLGGALLEGRAVRVGAARARRGSGNVSGRGRPCGRAGEVTHPHSGWERAGLGGGGAGPARTEGTWRL